MASKTPMTCAASTFGRIENIYSRRSSRGKVTIKFRRVIVGCSDHSSASSQPINGTPALVALSRHVGCNREAGQSPNPLWTLCKETITHGNRGSQIYCHRLLIFRLSLLLLKINIMAETRASASAQPTAAPHPAEPAEGQAAPVIAADGEVGQSVH